MTTVYVKYLIPLQGEDRGESLNIPLVALASTGFQVRKEDGLRHGKLASETEPGPRICSRPGAEESVRRSRSSASRTLPTACSRPH